MRDAIVLEDQTTDSLDEELENDESLNNDVNSFYSHNKDHHNKHNKHDDCYPDWHGGNEKHQKGTHHDDSLNGSDWNDKLEGDKGNDSLYGYAGKDLLKGGKDNDWLFGGDGDDKLLGGNGDDFLFGENGNDILKGEGGHDYLYGGYGDDCLHGDKGNDYLYGDYGYDILKGGSGADKFAFYSPWEGVDTIKDFTWKEGDKIEVSAFGFGIGTTDFHRFSYDNGTGALFFDQTQFASLQANLNPSGGVPGFDASLDIIIV